ncbi:MAG: cobyrinate a,c-diamide synthase [Nitrospirae bacterium]|nr:cobyrinate a,c-diamide synthase [Magnetococcales bacterium]HAT50145.1 cobyrinic acid a,c-diamide synthase [Alphaproteobacteria bacterium]
MGDETVINTKAGDSIPRVMIGAPKKSSGKTTICIGIVAALAKRGVDVRPFKKGPDFIDSSWLGRAAGRPCRNLDHFMMGREGIVENFQRYALGAGLALIEGNHGFFDGQDLEGGDCGAALAADLGAPVVLVVDCRGATRGMVPVVLGHLGFRDGHVIRGIILNNVASPRQEKRLRQAMERYVPIPVIGAVARLSGAGIEERHLGLHPVMEREELERKIDVIATMVADQVDLIALMALAGTAPPMVPVPKESIQVVSESPGGGIRIGYAVDQAFHFYYPDNLEALAAQGVELVPFSMLGDSQLPSGVQGLYIGGGFPEVFMNRLEDNMALMVDLSREAAAGMPIYAECGGLMVLAEKIHWGDRSARMAGVLPVDVAMSARPQGHGYLELEGTGLTEWPGEGVRVHCHEFHYSHIVACHSEMRFAFRVRRGTGIDGQHDGLIYRNVLASYAHFHAAGSPGWAPFLARFWKRGGGFA